MKDFNIRKELPFTGIEVLAEPRSLADTYNKLTYQKKVKELIEIKKLYKYVKKMYSFLLKSEDF